MDWDPADAWGRMAEYLCRIPDDVRIRPKAIVLISAHWEEDIVTIQSNPVPSLLFDYYGFPEHTYKLKYPAPGSVELAEQISALLGQADIVSRFDTERDFDHGVFIPLKLAFPEAEIPIVQISLCTHLDPAEHLDIGKALQPLRDEGVLIIGSGMSYHNMQIFMKHMRSSHQTDPESEKFDAWLTDTLTVMPHDRREQSLIMWDKAPAARSAHPREEHLLPLHVVVGAAGLDKGRKLLEDTVLGSAQSAFQFG